MSIEARYIHTTSYDSWTLRNLAGALNYNEINIVENNFLNEFRLAQANLVANIAAGRGSTFAYTGVPGTSPLPIFLAHLNGSSAATDTTKYTGTGWTNTTLVQSMYALNPNPHDGGQQPAEQRDLLQQHVGGRPAGQLLGRQPVRHQLHRGDQRRRHEIQRLQLILNRRYIQRRAGPGELHATARATRRTSTRSASRTWNASRPTRTASASLGNVRHNFALNWLYDLPFGQGKRFGEQREFRVEPAHRRLEHHGHGRGSRAAAWWTSATCG